MATEVVYLLSYDPHPYVVSGKEEINPLQVSCLLGDMEQVLQFLGEGEDVNSPLKNTILPNSTPLHCAVRGCRIEIVKELLLNRFIDPNKADQWGFSPLHYAVFTRNIDVIKLLLASGGRTGVESKNGSTALDIAKQLQYDEISSILSSKSILESDPQFSKFREWLVSLGAGEYISKFVEAGYDLRFVAQHGLTDEDLDCVGIPKAKLGIRRKIKSLHDIGSYFEVGEVETNEDSDEASEDDESENDDG